MKEKDIEDNLEKNLNKIENGLILVERQKRVDTGVIDLFYKDKDGKHVIVEIKRKPNTKVIVQLAKYNMAIIKSGFKKKRLRTILVAPESSKDVREACEFFNFEIKNIFKERNSLKKQESSNKNRIPNKEELMMFIKNKELINFSIIARHFNIKNETASDLVDYLCKNNLVVVKKFGGSNLVQLKKI